MFVFYFGIMADLTPPVALAAFAAASIAKASPMKTGLKATQIAIAGFVVPFMAVYDPALMLQGSAGWLATVYVVFKAVIAIVPVGFGLGRLICSRPLNWLERVLAAIAALLLVAAVPLTDEVGFALGAALIAWNWWQSRRTAARRRLMPLCIAAGGLVTALALDTFTLAWTHSIEKIRWEEDYRVEGTALRLTEARIRGSGAGMEPPPDARFDAGVWHYTPQLPPLPELRLTHSSYTAGYEICHHGHCEALAKYAPQAGAGNVMQVAVCTTASAQEAGPRTR